MTSAVTGMLARLERSAVECRRDLEQRLSAATAAGREKLTPSENRDWHALKDLESRIEFQREELARCGTLPTGGVNRALNSGARVAPLGFDVEDLRRAHDRLMTGETVRLEARALGYASAQSLLPAELAPWVTGIQHEGRILDALPAYSVELPSVEIIQVNSVTGQAAIVPEAGIKPEIVPVATPLTVTAQKIAAHMALSQEALADFDAFANFCRIELQSQVIQTENHELLYGTGGPTGIFGFFTATGRLQFDATGADQSIDAIEQAIAEMRVGPSLATPNLCVLHPSAWSAMRRVKDTLGRYLLASDPSEGEADSIWGIPVTCTTQCHTTDALLVDTQKYGRAIIREPLNMRIGWANDDLIRNLLRSVSEERLNNAIERPSAVMHVQNMPIPTEVRTAEGEAEDEPPTSKRTTKK